MLCVYVCRAHHLPTNVVHFVCVGTGFTVLLCAGAVQRAGTQHVWSASRRMRKVENISFKDFIMNMDRYCVYVLCVV